MLRPLVVQLGFLSSAMATPVVLGWEGIRAPVEGGALSARCCFPLQRAKLGKGRSRVACAGVDYAGEWRGACGELRVEMSELRGALADAWMQDEMRLLELEKLVSLLVASYAPSPDRASDALGVGELSVTDSASANLEAEADANAKPDLDDELYKNAMIVSELRSEEIRAKQEGLSTLRRLKTLNVHEYVHSALQASHFRSWLKSRGVAE